MMHYGERFGTGFITALLPKLSGCQIRVGFLLQGIAAALGREFLAHVVGKHGVHNFIGRAFIGIDPQVTRAFPPWAPNRHIAFGFAPLKALYTCL